MDVRVRPEQARAIASLLSDLATATHIAREAQLKVDHFCAGVLVGRVPPGAGVVEADPVACRVVVRVPEDGS